MKKLIIGVAVLAALVVPATASAATKTYGGKIKGGGKIGVDATVSGGDVTGIPEVRVKKLPANCDVSGPATVNGSVTFTPDLPADPSGKFAVEQGDPGTGNYVFFKGTFDGSKVRGRIEIHFHFTGPVEDCDSARKGFSAKRGAPGAKGAPGRALRILP